MRLLVYLLCFSVLIVVVPVVACVPVMCPL